MFTSWMTWKKTHDNLNSIENNNNSLPLCFALLTIASRSGVIQPLLQGEGTRDGPAYPSILKKQMDVLTDQFAGYEQRDAHEFIADIIDFLHDELTSAQEAKGEQLELELLTDKYFCLDVDVCLTCKLQILEVQSRIISPLVSRSWNTSRRSRGAMV